MLDDLANRVSEHPSCRRSLRYHWPGPHVHHIHGNDNTAATGSSSNRTARHPPPGTTTTTTVLPLATSSSFFSSSSLPSQANFACHGVVSKPGREPMNAQDGQAAATPSVVYICSREKHRTLCVTVRYGHAASLVPHAANPDAMSYLALPNKRKAHIAALHDEHGLVMSTQGGGGYYHNVTCEHRTTEKPKAAHATDLNASTDSDVFSHICLTLPEGHGAGTGAAQPGLMSAQGSMNTQPSKTTFAPNATSNTTHVTNATSTAPPGSMMDLSDTHRFEFSQSLLCPGRGSPGGTTRLVPPPGLASANLVVTTATATAAQPSFTNVVVANTQPTTSASCSCGCSCCCAECGTSEAELQTRPVRRARFCLYERVPSAKDTTVRVMRAEPPETNGCAQVCNTRDGDHDGDDAFHRDDEALELLSITTTSSCVYGLGLQGLELLGGEAGGGGTPIESPSEARKAAACCEKWLCAMKERAHKANARGLWALCQHCHAHPAAMSGTHSGPASALYDAILCCPRCSGQEKLDILYGARLPVCFADMQGGNGRIVRKMMMPFSLQYRQRSNARRGSQAQQAHAEEEEEETAPAQRSEDSSSARSQNASMAESDIVAQVNAWRDRQKCDRIEQWLSQVRPV